MYYSFYALCTCNWKVILKGVNNPWMCKIFKNAVRHMKQLKRIVKHMELFKKAA